MLQNTLKLSQSIRVLKPIAVNQRILQHNANQRYLNTYKSGNKCIFAANSNKSIQYNKQYTYVSTIQLKTRYNNQYRPYNVSTNKYNRHTAYNKRQTYTYTNQIRTQYAQRGNNNRQQGGRQIDPQIIIVVLRYIVRFLPAIWRSQVIQNLRTRYPKLFYALLGIPVISTGAYVATNLETVPYTNRLHLCLLGPEQEQLLGASAYNEVVSKESHRIVKNDPVVDQCQSVVNNIITVLQQDGQTHGMTFDLTVIDSDVANAFVLPNGKIFVYTGLFKMVQNEAGLALVLGHECSHAIARHAVEKIGVTGFSVLAYELLMGLRDNSNGPMNFALSTVGAFAAQAAIPLAHSRKLETEADKIGVTLSARAAYDPNVGKQVWIRMKESENSKQPFEWLSTHPSHETRIQNLDKWAKEATPLYLQAIEQRKQLGLRIPNSTKPILFRHHLPENVIKRYDQINNTALTSFAAASLAAGPVAEQLNFKLKL